MNLKKLKELIKSLNSDKNKRNKVIASVVAGIIIISLGGALLVHNKINGDSKNNKEIYENQESSDTLPFHWEFGKEEITLKVSSYAYGNGLAVLMYSQSEGELELFSDLTVNLPGGYGLKTQEAFVSGDFTRDKLAFIQENRLGKVLPGQARSGFATYTPVAFDLSRLSRYDREGVEEFCRQWGLDIPKEQEKVQGRSTGKKKRERER